MATDVKLNFIVIIIRQNINILTLVHPVWSWKNP